MAIGFLLGLLVELSSSWRPRFSLPPGPSAPAPRGSKRAAAGSSAAPAPGEELKMVGGGGQVASQTTASQLQVSYLTATCMSPNMVATGLFCFVGGGTGRGAGKL
nr:uncharacterized protein LOC109772620 isoform X1 [Aegilops tauschii subsp. strangulata]